MLCDENSCRVNGSRAPRSGQRYGAVMAQTPPCDETPLPHSLASVGESTPPAGWFRFHFADERWEWSPEVEQIHGYEAGTTEPTTELLLSHKHPDDYAEVAEAFEYVRRTHGAISTRHRIIDAHGQTREVIVVSQQLRDDTDTAIGLSGFYIDVTPSGKSRAQAERDREQAVTEALAGIAESREVIDQAKGMLMLVYQVEAERAFDLLKWRSQATNVKLRVLAQQLVKDFMALRRDEGEPPRSAFDRTLLTAHTRIDSAIAS
jgi:PAS domain S-box-containing protein